PLWAGRRQPAAGGGEVRAGAPPRVRWARAGSGRRKPTVAFGRGPGGLAPRAAGGRPTVAFATHRSVAQRTGEDPRGGPAYSQKGVWGFSPNGARGGAPIKSRAGGWGERSGR